MPRASAPLLSILVSLLAGCGLVLDLDPQAEDVGPDAEIPDAEPPDADVSGPDACVSRTEVCDGEDDDCDGMVDEGFDLSSDPMHCGGCGRVCPSRGGTARCVGGACEITCDPARADCDDDLATGCETALDDPSSCGACGAACPADRPACASAGGTFACVNDCPAPLSACGGTCVDLLTDEAHCGGCDDPCFADDHGTLECVDGACVVTDCGDWHADCNGDPSDGCERYILSDTDCGACGAMCAPGQVCDGGACVSSP